MILHVQRISPDFYLFPPLPRKQFDAIFDLVFALAIVALMNRGSHPDMQ